MKRTTAAWAFVAALGMSYLVVGLALALREVALPLAREVELTLTNRTMYLGGLAEPILLSVTFALGAASGTFVARRAGGAVTTTLYVAFVLVAGGSFVYAAFLSGTELERSCCVITVWQLPVVAAALCIPTLIGLLFGAAIARRRAEQAGANTFLEVAGSYAVVGALAATALGAPLPAPTWAPYALAFAPYATVGLSAPLHAVVVALQVIVSAAVYVWRHGTFDVRRFGGFAVIGLAGVAYADLLEVWFTLTLDHRYIPVSLIVVPLVSVALAAVLVFALRPLSPRTRVPAAE